MAEIAEMLGVVRQYVYRLESEDPSFPAPIAELAPGRVWKRADIVKWAKATGRQIELRAAPPSSLSARPWLARSLVASQQPSEAMEDGGLLDG